MTQAKRFIQSPLNILLIAYFILSIFYSRATPLLEASDELWHVGMVEAISNTGELPIQDAEHRETTWKQEGSQPPLYYLIAAGIASTIGIDDLDTLREPNPHAKAGLPQPIDNKNLVLHDEADGQTQAARAIYTIRLFSILLGAVTIVMVYRSAKLLAPRNPTVPIVAAGLTALNPMFIFIAASVNNDNLVTALNSAVIYLLLKTLRDGFDTKRSLLIAVLVTAATLSKLSGLILVPIIAIAALWSAWQRKNWRGLIILGTAMAAIWAIGASWWYLRNMELYGELFGTTTMALVAGPRLEPFSINTLFAEFEGFRAAYWGWFGGVNILTTPIYYRIMDIITVIGVIGYILYLRKCWRSGNSFQKSANIALLAMIILASLSIINWTAQTYASQGRLLFPFIAAISALLALGLDYFLRPIAMKAGLMALGLFAALIPFTTIAPYYTPPQPIDSLPASATPVYARYGDITLIGYEATDRRYEAGDMVEIRLYWQPLATSAADYSLFLHAVDSAGNVIGKIDTYPGRGLLRTSTWQAEVIYPDNYAILLEEDIEGRSALRVQVGWWDFESGEYLSPVDAEGKPIDSVMLNVGGVAGEATPLNTEGFIPVDNAHFGNVIQLKGYQLSEDNQTLSLWWQATGTPDDHYTVFVQVLDEENNIIGQGDAPPSFPTGYWRNGEQYITQHTIQYPETPTTGEYRIITGWYHPVDWRRLSTNTPDAAYEVARITFSGS